MKIALVLTDSSVECERAFRMLAECERAFSADVSALVVLEDLHRLRSAGVSLGVPLLPDTVSSAEERTRGKVRRLWRRVKEDEDAEIETHLTVGELLPEVESYLSRQKPDMLIWGCIETGSLCRAIEETNVPSLIIK